MQKGSVFCQKFDQRSLNDDKFCFLLLFLKEKIKPNILLLGLY
jgi:hypothetical protein